MDIPVWLQVIFMVVSSVLSVVVAYLGKKIAKEQDRRDAAENRIAKEEQALKNGIRAILRDRLLYVCTQCERHGYLTLEDTENIAELFESYYALGGNGAVKKIYEDTIKLPIKNHRYDNHDYDHDHEQNHDDGLNS